MPGDSGTIEKLPKELLLRILRHLYPPAAFQPFDMESNCQEDNTWHDRLLSTHLDIVSVSKVSRLFHALSVHEHIHSIHKVSAAIRVAR